MSSTGLILTATRRAFPEATIGALTHRGRMVAAAIATLPVWRPMAKAAPSSASRRLLALRPEILGAAIWPYQNATWDARTRLGRIAAHCREVDRLGGAFDFDAGQSVVLADLGARHPGLRLVLDQPTWFMREGGLTLNLFVDSFRAYSIAFSFFRDTDGALAIYVGALQGRRIDAALDLYRDLTRALHGIRPRDFMVDALRIVGAAAGAEALYAVSDAARQHRHGFFGTAKAVTQDYDDVWRERGGRAVSEDTFRLPMAQVRRPIEDVKPNKRSLYRQRYAFLDALGAEVAAAAPAGLPVVIADV